MRMISLSELNQSPELYNEIAEILENDGLICFPANNTYRLATRFHSEKAIVRFIQTKRRTRKSPVLTFIPHAKMLPELVDEITPQALRLMRSFWPGALTLVFKINPDLPRKLIKTLNSKKKIGVRVPEDPVASQIVKTFNKPLLVSSATLAGKKGVAYSEAQIRKNFAPWVDLLIYAGDLREETHSTVVDVTNEKPKIVRQGNFDPEEMWALLNEGKEENEGKKGLQHPTPIAV